MKRKKIFKDVGGLPSVIIIVAACKQKTVVEHSPPCNAIHHG
ncbi:MAG TPA: hypothetical protein VIM75_20505 [Ohtaekwangia sp.]